MTGTAYQDHQRVKRNARAFDWLMDMVRDRELLASDVRVAGILLVSCDASGAAATITRDEIAKLCGMTSRNAGKCLARLKDAGRIGWYRLPNGTNCYLLPSFLLIDEPAS